jgi:hypothetical protein
MSNYSNVILDLNSKDTKTLTQSQADNYIFEQE